MRREEPPDIRPMAVVLDCGLIGSAVAVALFRAGYAVVLLDEADPPWPHRGMSFTDAWYVGTARLDGVDALFCANLRSIPIVLDRHNAIAATTWSWRGIAAAFRPAVLVDARPRAHPGIALADMPGGMIVVGVGPGFVAGEHVHAAIALPPEEDAQAQAFRVVAPAAGRFTSRRGVGDLVARGEEVGRIGDWRGLAPVGGVLRGVTARGARPQPGGVVIDVDPGAGPVNAMAACANGCAGVAVAARAAAKTGRLRKASNKNGRPGTPVPFGLRPKRPCALLRSPAAFPTRLRRSTQRMTFSASQRARVHSVNRPLAGLCFGIPPRMRRIGQGVADVLVPEPAWGRRRGLSARRLA